MPRRRFRWALVVALVTSAAAAGQSTIETYSVSGSVTNSVTGEPMLRALVVASCVSERTPTSLSAMTDARGRYRLEGLRGECRLSAEKPAHRLKAGGESRAISAARDNVNLVLEPAASVSGTVVDDNGEPWPLVQVEGFRVSLADGRRRVVRDVWFVTDDRGRYRFFRLWPGLYYLRVAGRPGATYGTLAALRDPGVPNESFAPTYFGGGASLDSAAAIRLEAGQNLTANFTLTRQPGYALHGFVSNLMQYRTARIEILRDGELLPAGTVWLNPASGQFRAYGLVNGVYTIRAVQGEKDAESRAEQIVGIDGAAATNVALNLAAGGPVRARVRIEEEPEAPRAGRRVFAQLRLQSTDRLFMAWTDLRLFDATTGSDGMATIAAAPPGRYRASVHGQGFVRSLTCGDVDLLRSDLVVPPGGLAQPIEAVLTRKTGLVTGMLTPPGSHVVLLPESGPAPLAPLYAWGAEGGRFFIGGVPPGEYRPFAWTGGTEFEYADAAAVRAKATAGERFRVDENGKHEIRIEARELR